MNNDTPIVHWKDYATLASELMAREKIEEIVNKPVGSGLNELDAMLDGGFKPGELIILSAPTSQGKSTLAQTITWNMANLPTPSGALWFTMEMSWQELTKKFMAMDERLKTGRLPSLAPIIYPLENYVKGGDLQMRWLRDTISESKRLNNIDFVVIDHLHFLLPLKDYSTNVSFLIGSIVREVKKIAVDLQIPIMLIAHTTKLDVEKTPDINSLRDSSFVAQEADFVLMMWRIRSKDALAKSSDDDDDKTIVYTNKAWLSLEKNRRTGRTGRIKLRHTGAMFIPYTQEMRDEDAATNFVKYARKKGAISVDEIPL